MPRFIDNFGIQFLDHGDNVGGPQIGLLRHRIRNRNRRDRTSGYAGQQGEIGGNAKFSGTFGAGLKLYPGRHAGVRLQARWTPTYIKSDSEGYWCDPYWGCYTVGNAQYSNQFELTGGITLHF